MHSKLIRLLGTYFSKEKNWVFATSSNVLIPISLQPDLVNLWYFKLSLFSLKEFKGLRN